MGYKLQVIWTADYQHDGWLQNLLIRSLCHRMLSWSEICLDWGFSKVVYWACVYVFVC